MPEPTQIVALVDNDMQPAAQKRIVLTNVALSGIVENPAETIIQLTNMTAELGGWVVSSSATRNSGQSTGTITMRIPAEKMQDALVRTRALMQSITNENNSGQDVTQDYVDTTSQITNLEAAEANLKKIMDASQKTEDVLKVFNELTTIRNQIETAKGKIKYWNEAAAYASLTVNLAQKASAVAAPVSQALNNWTPANTFQSAIAALTQATQILVDALIWLAVVVLPFAIPALVVYVIWRRVRGVKARA
jgi:hypothetical protein